MNQQLRAGRYASALLLIVLVVGSLVILGCGGGSSGTTSDSPGDDSSDDGSSGDDSPATTTPDEVDSTPFATSVADSASTYDASDVVDNVAFPDTITIDFAANTAQVSSGDAQTITSDGVTLLCTGGGSVVITKTADGVTVSSTAVGNVKYDLSGRLNGTLTVSSTGAHQLYLDGLTINATAGPALDLESAQKAFIVTASGTTNTLTDSATRTMTMKAALYGKGPLIFSGNGALSVTGSYKHGIFSSDYIRVRGGTLSVAVSARDAVRSVNGFIFDDGNLTVTATGNTTDDESKGIKVEGSESTGTGKGFIVINGGEITVTSVGKAMTAGWDIDEDATTTTTSDDPSPYVEVNKGILTLTTTGTPYEYVSGGDTVSCSPEGIEAKSDLTINSGYLNISTTDDALNAGTSATINGGYTYCASSRNDAVDSNGELTIAGGVMVAIGSGQPEGPFDCDQNRFLIRGGTFVGIGGTTSRPTGTQNTVVLGSLPGGSTVSIRATDGTCAFSYAVPQACATMVLSCPGIETGTAYSVYTGGTVTAANVFKGLYVGSLGHTCGAVRSGFTAASGVTKLGGVYF